MDSVRIKLNSCLNKNSPFNYFPISLNSNDNFKTSSNDSYFYSNNFLNVKAMPFYNRAIIPLNNQKIKHKVYREFSMKGKSVKNKSKFRTLGNFRNFVPNDFSTHKEKHRINAFNQSKTDNNLEIVKIQENKVNFDECNNKNKDLSESKDFCDYCNLKEYDHFEERNKLESSQRIKIGRASCRERV